MGEARHSFMSQILHRHVALDDTLCIVLRLMDVGITHAEGTHPGIVSKKFRKGHLALNLHTDIIEVERSGMEDVVGRIHHPINHLCATMIEASNTCHCPTPPVLGSKREGVIVLGFQVAIAFVSRTLVIEFSKGGQAETFVVGEEQFPTGCGTIGNIDTRIEAEMMVDGRSHACHEACRDGPMPQQDVVLEAEGDRRTIIVPSIKVPFWLAITSQIRA